MRKACLANSICSSDAAQRSSTCTADQAAQLTVTSERPPLHDRHLHVSFRERLRGRRAGIRSLIASSRLYSMGANHSIHRRKIQISKVLKEPAV